MTAEQRTLPQPNAAAQAHSERLQQLIRHEISASGGQISFARYMELALYAPGLGYYSAGSRKFGAQGDFVTAPELSPLFSRCLARQCQQVLVGLDQQNILEFGAGSGMMAADLLRELEYLDCLPQRYLILEISADLHHRQRETLQRHIPHLLPRIEWLDTLPDHDFEGVILANEVLDAMPVHRFLVGDEGPQECYVTCQDGHFTWHQGPLSDPRLAARIGAIEKAYGEQDLPTGYCSEINLDADAWLSTIGASLAQGALFILDYGFPRREYYHPQRSSGTLMCHYRHRSHGNPLILTGLQDISAHVDFTAVAEAAQGLDLMVSGYTTQAYFLLGNGLTDMAQQSDAQDLRAQLKLAQQIKTLTLPSEMGELIKVMALTRNIDTRLAGFTLRDLRHRL